MQSEEESAEDSDNWLDNIQAYYENSKGGETAEEESSMMEAVEDMKNALAAANGEKASEEETGEEVEGAVANNGEDSTRVTDHGKVQGKADDDGSATVHVTTMATSGDGESHDDAHGMVVHVTYQDICEFA